MSNINESPVAGEISNPSAQIHPALIDSMGGITAVYRPSVTSRDGSETPFRGDMTGASGVLDAAGILSTVR